MPWFLFLLALCLNPIPTWSHGNIESTTQWVAVRAKDKVARTKLINQGLSIESVVDDMSYGFAPESIVKKIIASGAEVTAHFPADTFTKLDFPAEDAIYHNYGEMAQALADLADKYPTMVHRFSLGKTIEGRDIWGVRLNPHVEDASTVTALPGIVFMGGHHAREHLSMELPMLYAEHLASNYGKDPVITDLMDKRDIYFIPMVNADGAEFDVATGSYKMWRKNRKINAGNANCPGVDLNRNYGFQWGTGGSSTNACSDVFMGAQSFSEPETQAVKRFVESRPNLKILLSFHTYSELILYPWGHKYDPITNARDLATYEKMARTMATWNGYTPQQSSDLYIASGDTTDWSYGTLGIFSFTFELSPRDSWGGGGFYPGAGAIATSFQANLRPILYLIDLADDPYRATVRPETTLFYGR
jgi:carboxypeptidase T